MGPREAEATGQGVAPFFLPATFLPGLTGPPWDASGYNFLNQPLWSFNGTNLNLGFDGTTGKLNTPNFEAVTDNQGAT